MPQVDSLVDYRHILYLVIAADRLVSAVCRADVLVASSRKAEVDHLSLFYFILLVWSVLVFAISP